MLRNSTPAVRRSPGMATIWSGSAMADQHNLKDPTYWRSRAKEARAEADQMLDQRTKRALLAIADNYDELAERAEAMVNSRKPPTQ
jgi:hypothetical protein